MYRYQIEPDLLGVVVPGRAAIRTVPTGEPTIWLDLRGDDWESVDKNTISPAIVRHRQFLPSLVNLFVHPSDYNRLLGL